MGANQSAVIGHDARGREIRDDKRNEIVAAVNAGVLKTAPQDPELDLYWGEVDGVKYYKRPTGAVNAIKAWFADPKNKQELVSKLVATGKFTAATALKVVDAVAMPAAIAGSVAADAAVAVAAPEAAPVAIPIVDAALIAAAAAAKQGAKMGVESLGYAGGFDASDFPNEYSGMFEPAEYEGGCDTCGRCGAFGGAELDTATVREYSESRNSASKDRLINDISSTVEKLLGKKIDGKDRAEKVKRILEELPSGDRIKAASDSHKRICGKIAEAINAAHGSKVINKDLPPEVICQQVSELVSSLAASMHPEFLSVYNDVRRVLSNLHVLKQALEDDFAEIKRQTDQSDDALLRERLTTFMDLHKMLTEEIDRQATLLQNLLNVTLIPTDKELAALIKKGKNIPGYIEKLDYTKPQSAEKFSKVISDVLKGLGVTANFALLVDRALKTVGMTLDEYVRAGTLKTLREKITSGQMDKKLDENKLHEYLQAAELLYRNFYRAQDIAKVLTDSEKSGKYEPEPVEMATGGDEKYQKSIMDRRILDRKRLRNLIFNAFYKRVNDIFDQMVHSMDVLSKKVGSEIPLSDQLDGFRSAIQRVNVGIVQNKNIWYALIGYYNDAMSKSKRENLIGELKMLISYVDTILEMPLYKGSAQYFQDVKRSAQAIIETVDKYTDEIASKFGRGEDGDCQYMEEKEGGAEGDDPLMVEPKFVKRTSKTIEDAFRQFDYYYRVAQIRSNLGRTAKELDHYAEKYDKIVATSVADILEQEKKVYDGLRRQIDKVKPADLVLAAATPFKDEPAARKEIDAARNVLDAQWEAKKKFWATVEAVDTYMRVFTDGIVKHPNDIKDINAMLGDIETINDWYSEATGNTLAGVFDFFPSTTQGRAVADADVTHPHDDYTKDGDRRHYYARIGQHKVNPGNPYLVADPVRGLDARNRIRKTFQGLGILKNLISVFVHIGSKFGGEELRKKVFMTPAQIYNNLVEYLQASALAQGFGWGEVKDSCKDLWDEEAAKNWTNDTNVAAQVRLDNGSVTANVGGAVYQNDLVSVGVVASKTALHAAPLTAVQQAENNILLFKKHFGVWMRSCLPELQSLEGSGFKREDDYFTLMLKSIAAKIFTVTGMYDVMDRPLETNSFTPIRMLLGGADETPKIDDGAVELYLRLPLLARFYQKLFGWEESGFDNYSGSDPALGKIPRNGNDALKISLVPDVEGTFSGLIRLIFRKTKNVYENAYSDEEIKELVRECNQIYQKMQAKHPQNTIMETIHEFVAEINRRYQIVSKDERDKYEREFGYRYEYSDIPSADKYDRYTEAPDQDYAILPGEADEEPSRPSPAERMLSVSFNDKPKKESMFTITQGHKTLVYRFRCMLDKFFENAPANEEFTFKHAIKSAQMKLKKESRDAERFKIVSALVRGVDIYSRVDHMKYVLFHETVVSGLNVLSAIHSMLARFRRRALYIDLAGFEEAIVDAIDKVAAGGAIRVNQELVTGIIEHIKKYIDDAEDPEIQAYVKHLLGYDSAEQRRGGHLEFVAGAAPEHYILKAIDGVRKNVGGTAANNQVYRDGSAALQKGANGAINGPSSGLLGLLAGMTVDQIRGVLRGDNKNADHKRRVRAVFRYLFDREFVMLELLETLFGLGQDFQGLVDVKLEDGRLFLNWGGLKSAVEDMFGQVAYFIDLLRPHVNSKTFDKYVKKINPGSFYWLQEQLMEKIIVGRPRDITLPASSTEHGEYLSIDEVARRLGRTYQSLTQVYDFDGAGLKTVAEAAQSVVNQAPNNQTSYDKVFAFLAFYDAALPNSGLMSSLKAPGQDPATKEANDPPRIVDYKTSPYEGLHLHGGVGSKVLDSRFAARFYQLYSWDKEFTLNRSALFAFNQLVAKYIQNFFDVSGTKIYLGAINAFANGAFNKAVMEPGVNTYPDTAASLFVKFAGTSDHKFPNANNLKALIAVPALTDPLINTAAKVIRNLIDAGYGANTSGSERANLLNPTTYPGTQTWVAGRAGAVAGVATLPANPAPSTRLYLHLIAALLASAIHDLFQNVAAPSVAQLELMGVSRFDATTAAAPGPIALAAATTLYTANAKPTLAEIMAKITRGNDSDIAARVLAALNHAAAGGASNAGLLHALRADPIVKPYYDVYNELLHRNLGTANIGEIVLEAARTNAPFRDNMIDDYSGNKSQLFASIMAALQSSFVNHPGGGAPFNPATARELIAKNVNGVPSTYSPPVLREPSFAVKMDDAMAAVTDNLDAAIPNPTSDGGWFRLARTEGDANLLPADSWKKLGDQNPASLGGSTSLADVKAFGRRRDPDSEHVLFSSLAVVLKNLLTSRNTSNQALIYIADNIADVALYMKERFRANMPAFKQLFKELLNRCEFLKRVMSRPEVSLKRSYGMVRGDAAPNNNPWPFVLKAATTGSDETKNRFMGVLDAIVRGCTAFISSCDQVLREVGDDPKYLELYQNSIKDYKGQYGFDPFMPMSSVLSILKNVNGDNYLDFFPIHSLGEDQFKFMYGTRMLLQRPEVQPTLEHNPGFGQTVEAYNLLLEARSQADKARAESFMKTFVKLTRWLFELKHVKGALTPYIQRGVINDRSVRQGADLCRLLIDGSFVRDDLVYTESARGQPGVARAAGGDAWTGIRALTNKAELSITAGKVDVTAAQPIEHLTPVYQIAKTLQESIKLTESSFREDKIRELVEYLIGEDKKRDALDVQNIIDLNIIPINIHALMREVPLANLYNYAYTFDRLIIELYYGLGNENARKLISELCLDAKDIGKFSKINSAKDMLVALLLRPYMNVSHNADSAHPALVKRMLLGGTGNELGRPKFLSDQLYGKAVFGELYESRAQYDEHGPAVALAGMNRSDFIRNAGLLLGDHIARWIPSAPATVVGAILNGGLIGAGLNNYCTAVMRHALEKPSASAKQLLDTLPADVAALAAPLSANVAALNQVVVGVANALAEPLLALYADARRPHAADAVARRANFVHFVTEALAQQLKPGAYYGLGASEEAAAHALAEQSLQAGVAVGTAAVDPVAGTAYPVLAAGGVAGWANQGGVATAAAYRLSAAEREMLRRVAKRLVSSAAALPNLGAGAVTIHASSNDAILNRFTGYRSLGRPVAADSNLHYLGSVDHPAGDELGAVIEPDNVNVLDPAQVQTVDVAGIEEVLHTLGHLRFDTVFIRNLLFIVNLYRSVRVKLNRDLMYNRDVIVRSAAITRPSITEFRGNEIDTDRVNYRNDPRAKRYAF